MNVTPVASYYRSKVGGRVDDSLLVVAVVWAIAFFEYEVVKALGKLMAASDRIGRRANLLVLAREGRPKD